jgi:hypothetical protein
MTDAHREESETGKYSLWVHVKNWITDYLKSTDLNLDGNKNVGVSVKDGCLVDTELNLDGNKNVGVNVKSITEEDPDAATKNNPDYSFAYDVNGRLQYIYWGDGVNAWRKTLTYSSGVLQYISEWVKQ